MSNTYAGFVTGGIGYLVDREKVGVYAGYVFLPEDHPLHDKLAFNPKTLNVYGVECEPTGLGLVGEHPKFGVTVDQINIDPSLFNKNVAILMDAVGESFVKFSVFKVVDSRGYRVTSQIVRKIASDLSPNRLLKPTLPKFPPTIDYLGKYLEKQAIEVNRTSLVIKFDHCGRALVEHDGRFLALINCRDLVSITTNLIIFDATRDSYPGGQDIKIDRDGLRYRIVISSDNGVGTIRLTFHK